MCKVKVEKIKDLAVSKARQSACRYKISAIGLNKKLEVIYSATNKPRFSKPAGGRHAEMDVFEKAGPGLKFVIIARINNKGELLPISPCKTCSEKAEELGIKILSCREE